MWRRGSDGRRGRSGGAGDAGGSVGEGAMEITLEELREFMEADLVDVHSDPEFKHSLRNRLWELVQARNAQRGRGSSRH